MQPEQAAPAAAAPADVATAESAPAGEPARDESAGTEPSTSETPSPAEPSTQPPEEEPILERTRRTVRSTTEWLARGVDSWFGDKPFEEGGSVTNGRLSVGFLQRQGENDDVNVRLNARFRLPNVQERSYFFVGRDNEQEVVADTPGAFSRQDRLLTETPEERSFFAGLGVALRRYFDLRIGFHGFKPYGQVRYRRPWNLSQRDLVEFRQTFFWRLHDHFGSTTALSYEHAVSSTLAVRWLNATTITQRTERFDWSSIVGGYKAFPGDRLLSLELIAIGRQGTGVLLSDVGIQTKWLQPVYRDWLFGELTVGHFWPRPDEASERTKAWAVGAAVTMRF